MKLFIFLSLLSVTSFAAEVKISSFQYLSSTRVAELCGFVTGVAAGELVEVVSDPKMKVPGHYTTLTNSTGKFCLVLRTLSGEADVTHGNNTTEAFQSK
jgi:hypothetical protein